MHDLSFRDRAVFLAGPEVLVVADLHVGRDEASGVEFPLGERSDLHERLDRLLAHYDPAEVVVAGDVLHSFSHVAPSIEASLYELAGCCHDVGARLVLVAGNHDTVLSEVWDGPVHDSYRLDDGTVICHGHELVDDPATRYVVGHDHPAIEIEGRRRPCYLFGEGVYRGTDVLMLPAFNRLAAGVPVNEMQTSDFQSPFVTDADVFRPIVYDADSHETLRFPPLGEFRRML
ncbi:putative phosphoesterase [Halogranum amylolyticum]|uniref:Putative phosphoesterase n=1 Tax=Halogranum amylolyticum TaxID=660520 RepID=A0A1H8PFC0_9EURY|nr:metallophosphoesterase [Halogranum amylolyticum]SEO40605.1 putative phosphoesterase [Halogranum amylolyticum]